MRLAEDLERQLGAEQSMFRAQLLREDLARLRKLCELASAAADRAAFAAAAPRLGWTQGDEIEARIRDAWAALTRERLERLVGCLTMRVPPPDD